MVYLGERASVDASWGSHTVVRGTRGSGRNALLYWGTTARVGTVGSVWSVGSEGGSRGPGKEGRLCVSVSLVVTIFFSVFIFFFHAFLLGITDDKR